jgi:hypothetical protein
MEPCENIADISDDDALIMAIKGPDSGVCEDDN